MVSGNQDWGENKKYKKIKISKIKKIPPRRGSLVEGSTQQPGDGEPD